MPWRSSKFYLSRAVDEQLTEATRTWLASDKRVAWIGLSSAPGHGNTSFLENFRRHLESSNAFGGTYRIIFAHGAVARPGAPPSELGPVSEALKGLLLNLRFSRLRRIQRRISNASPLQLVKCVAVGLTCLVAACLLAGVAEYVTTSNNREATEFLQDYLPRNWRVFPVWLLSASAVSFPFSLLVIYLARNRLLPEPWNRQNGLLEIRELLTSPGWGIALEEVTRGKRGAVLLIDDIQWLPRQEALYLDDLLGGKYFRKRRLLIIALESDGFAWGRHFDIAPFTTLSLPPFDLAELHEISRLTSGASQDRLDLEQADGNVKAIFSHLDEKLFTEAGNDFQKTREAEISSVFDLSTLMAYQAVRQAEVTTRTELLEWLEQLSAGDHLREFKLRAPSPVQPLVKAFSNCHLIRRAAEQCRFDSRRCAALRGWLKKNDPNLLSQAHYFWFRSLVDETGGVHAKDCLHSLSDLSRLKIKRAAWHAAHIGVVLDKALDVLSLAADPTDTWLRERSEEVACTLLNASALWRGDADLIESNDLIADIPEWLCNDSNDFIPGQAIDQIWRNYWLSGDKVRREQALERFKSFPQAQSAPAARVHRRYEQLLQGVLELDSAPSEEELQDPFLLNLHRLTEALRRIRQCHGFPETAFEDATLEISVAAPSAEEAWPELELRMLMISAQRRRQKLEDMWPELIPWRDLLLTHRQEGRLGAEVLHHYQKACYLHQLTQIGKDFAEKLENSEGETLEPLYAAFLGTPAPQGVWQEVVFDLAKDAYQRCIHIAALLGWRVLVLRASFGLATFLEQHTPLAQRGPTSWWEVWDRLFNHCLEIERELGWCLYRPIIHSMRFAFFKEESLESSVEDAYNTFIAIKEAHYPGRVMLEWHQRVAVLLNNYGNSETDRRRSAEMHEIWARELAALPEAESLRRYQKLQHEQADELLFVAQGLRLVNDLGRADQILREAESLLTIENGEESSEQDREILQQLRNGLRLQLSWLREQQGKDSEARALLHEALVDTGPDDTHCLAVFRSLVSWEFKDGLLDSPWPSSLELPPHADPENDRLSLPLEWLADPRFHLQSRFEFRLYQLLSFINVAPYSTLTIFKMTAILAWKFKGKEFADTALRIAQLGLHLSLEVEVKQIVIHLLQAVWLYFAEIEEVDTDELESLRLLMEYARDRMEYQGHYVAALLRHERLLKHELAVQELTQRTDWLGLARRVKRYFGVLTDPVLQTDWIRTALSGTGISLDQFLASHSTRVASLNSAQAKFDSGDSSACLHEIGLMLSFEKPAWVFMEDLQVFDLWLRASERQGGFSEERIARVAAQLRQLSLRFVRQISGTIREEQVQRLAFELLQVSGASQEVPGAPRMRFAGSE